MTVVVFILTGVLLVVIQTVADLVYPLELYNPDLYYLLIAFLAFRLDLFRSLLIVFPISWTLDIVSGIFLGFYPVLCFGGYFFLKIAADRLPVKTSYYHIPFVALSYVLVSLLLYLVISFFSPESLADGSWKKLAVRAVLILVLAPPFFRLFERIYSAVTERNRHHHGRLFTLKRGNRYR